MFDAVDPSPEHDRAAWRATFIAATNRVLASLARSRRWQGLTRWLFRSRLVTVGFDALISRAMADMSVCRNSTAIPLLSDRANLSFYCTGGITWGRNRPDHLTSGWPWDLFRQAVQAVPAHDRPDSGGAP
jgi:hypothetical protein